MKAAQLSSFGPPTQLQIVEVSRPEVLEPADVLVRVVTSGFNPIEWKVRSGAMGQALRRPLPAVLGWECAGVVENLGSEVKGFSVGDEVFALTPFSRDGTHAEFVAVDQNHLAHKPASLSFDQAAATPMTSQAAWSMIEAAGLLQGKRVLILGAGGSVGHWLVQLAKEQGAHICATASGLDLQAVLALGADDVLDHRTMSIDQFEPVDIVFDLIGGEQQASAWKLIKAEGQLISIASPPDASLASALDVRGQFVFTQPRGVVLAEIARRIDAGRLLPLAVAAVRPLGDIAAIHAEAEARSLRGKTVLRIGAP
ncbi:MAG: NADP-dependent oxidoreductase [Rhizobacter sp.]|nr:NADP-dependent oxidoreductase [Rhizobacter sp.]